MKSDDFESRLQRQPLRPIPPDWRQEILSAAREAQAPAHASRFTFHAWLAAFNSQLTAFFWPHPKAWAGLAAVWLSILILNFSMSDRSVTVAEKASPASPEILMQLHNQHRMFAELVGSSEAPDAARTEIFTPKPRSARTEILVI